VVSLAGSFRAQGLPVPNPDRLAATIGLSLHDSLVRASSRRLTPTVLEELSDRYRQLYIRVSRRYVRPFPEVRALVRAITRRGLRVALATSKSRTGTDAFVQETWEQDPFWCIVTDDDVAAKKPAPEMLELIMARMTLDCSQVLMVGDTSFDIEMGRAAGTRTCGVTWGNHSHGALVKAGAGYVVDSPGQLAGLVEAVADGLAA
jgi:phosphoglycolate phosphatase